MTPRQTLDLLVPGWEVKQTQFGEYPIFQVQRYPDFLGFGAPNKELALVQAVPYALNLPMRVYVLTEWECNGYSDSDFFASVFNPVTGQVELVEVGSTRYAGGIVLPSHAPLTAEVVSRAMAWLEDTLFNRLVESDKLASKTPSKGKLCKVIAGRKVKIGTLVKVVGTPVKERQVCYGHVPRTMALCSLPDGSMQRLNVANLGVVNANDYFTDTDTLRAKATAQSSDLGFSRAVSSPHAWDSTNHVASFLAKLPSLRKVDGVPV